MKKYKVSTLFPSLSDDHICTIYGDSDQLISGITHDSRLVQQDYVFCAVKLSDEHESYWYAVNSKSLHGYFFNHEAYIEDAIHRGARVVVTAHYDSELIERHRNVTFIIVEDVIAFLGLQVAELSKNLDDTIIAITGSSSKTTCVKILEEVAIRQFPDKVVLRLYSYRLTPISLPMKYYDALFGSGLIKGRIVILEMATDRSGSIQRLCSILSPSISAVLNIEDAHINNFGTQENIARAKSEIVLGTKDNGFVFLNGDDRLVVTMRDINPRVHYKIYKAQVGIYARCESYDDDLRHVVTALYVNGERVTFKSSFLSFSMDSVYTAVANIAYHLSGVIDFGFQRAMAAVFEGITPLEGRMSTWSIQLGEHKKAVIFDNTAKINSSNLQKLLRQAMPISQSNCRKVLVLFEFRSADHMDPSPVFWDEVLDYFDDVVFVGHEAHIDSRIEYCITPEEAVVALLEKADGQNFIVVAGRSSSLASQFVSLCKSLSANSEKLVVIAHGWSSEVSDWAPISNLLMSAGYKVEAISFPGLDTDDHVRVMGGGIWGVREYSEYTLNCIMREVGEDTPREIIFIGHSFGGRIGIYLASQYRNLFAEMILTGAAGIRLTVSLKAMLIKLSAQILRILPLSEKVKQAIRSHFIKRVTYQGYSRLDDHMKRVFQRIVGYDLQGALSMITTKTTLIWGKDDMVTPLKMGESMHLAIKDSLLIVIDGAGHNAFETHPHEWLGATRLISR